MSKIKKILYISLSVLLLAFSFLFPLKNQFNNLKNTSAVDTRLEIQQGFYIFKDTSDTSFIFPDTDFIIDNCDISFYMPSDRLACNGNRIVYTASTRSLVYQVYDYKNEFVIDSGSVLVNGVWANGGDLQPRYLFFNKTILLYSDIWNFFDKNTNRRFSDSSWCTFDFHILGFDGIGTKLNFINGIGYNKYRYYFLNDDITSTDVDSNFVYDTNEQIISTISNFNDYYYLMANIPPNVYIYDTIYTIRLYTNYYFYTLANNNINLQYYNNNFYNFEFQILNSDTNYYGVKFAGNFVQYSSNWNNTSFTHIAYYENQSTNFNWVFDNYNPLIIEIRTIIDTESLPFIFNNFYLSNSYYENVVNNKNEVLINLKNDYTLLSLFTTMFDSALNTFKSMFNFNFFGFNLFSLMTSILTLSLVIFIFKLLTGGKKDG